MATSKFMLSEETGMTKWKIAAAVGGAALAGVGIYMFYKKATVKSDGKRPKGTSLKGSKTSNGTSTEDNAVGKARKYKTEGNNHFRAGAYTEAIRCYDKAIENCPKDASNDLSTFYQNRAAAFEHEKEWESVLNDCTSALELNPRYGKAMQRRARAAEHLGDLDTALEDYTAICIIESFSNQESLTQVDRILKKIGLQHAQETFGKSHCDIAPVYAIRSYFKGFCCDPVYNSLSTEKEGDGDEVEDIPEKNIVTDGYLRALQHMRAERFEAVLECCRAELSNPLSTYTAPALLLQGAMYAVTLQRSKATESFNKLAEMEEADKDLRVAALVKLGCLEMAFGVPEEAALTYNRALNLDTKNADVYHQRGQMHLMMNDIKSAMVNFDQVVQLNDDFAIGHIQKLHTDYRYAVFSGNRSKAKEVMVQFEQLQKKFPKCIEGYLLLAQILMDDEDYTGADAHFEKLFAVEPNSPIAHVYRAMLLVQWKGDISGAKKMMHRALQIDKHCELALENLATICVQTGDLEQGVRLFNRAIPLAKSLHEMAHYCSLRDAAVAQIKVVARLGIQLPTSSGM